MPARLKSFELHGYKTFASRTEFVFADGVTAIVGPNGSGKSNIADALRWVLGEQSYGLLRGKRTEDMIFAGSEQRSRAGMAQATVVFDNSDGWLPIDFSEVAITRRAYRDGDNEYLLNGQRVRLRDVSELLSKSGLAERTYTIIGQGLVDAALALKAEERRRLFEEAAGIGLYRARREEALRRLESTRRNLERVQDILAELQPRLKSLEKQAKRAQEYEQIRADLGAVLKEWYGYHWHRAQAEYTEAQIIARKQEEALTVAQQAQMNLDDKLSSLRRQLQRLRIELGDVRQKLTDLRLKQETFTRRMAVSQERVRSLRIQKEENTTELTRRQEILILVEERKLAVRLEQERLLKELADYKEHLIEAETVYNRKVNELTLAEYSVKEARGYLAEITSRQAYLRARLEEKRVTKARLQTNLVTTQGKIEQLNTELQKHLENSGIIQRQLAKAKEQLSAAESEYTEIRARFEAAEIEDKRLVKKLEDLDTQFTRLRTEYRVLEQAEKGLTGYADGARLLLQSMKPMGVNSLLGAVGSFLLVPSAYELAISTALGEYVDTIIFKDSAEVDKSLDFLIEKKTRGSIFPLDAINLPGSIRIDQRKAPGGQDEIIGIASELVKYPPEYRDIVDLLLGQVIVVKDRSVARTLLSGSNWRSLPGLRVVTLTGELYLVNGMIAIGSSRGGILSRPRNLSELKKRLEKAEDQYNQIKAQQDETSASLRSLSNQLKDALNAFGNAQKVAKDLNDACRKNDQHEDGIRRNLAWYVEQKSNLESESFLDQEGEQIYIDELEQINGNIDSTRNNLQQQIHMLEEKNAGEAQAQVAYWQTRVAVVEQASSDLAQRCKDRTAEVEQVGNEISTIQRRIAGIDIELGNIEDEQMESANQDREVREEYETVLLQKDPLELEVNKLEEEQTDLLALDADARQRFRTAEHYHAQAKINLARRQEALDSLRRRVEDDFGLVSFEYAETVSGPKPLPLDGMVEELPYLKELSPETEEIIHRQRNQLKRMGPVNFEAQSEYTEVHARFKFMTDQVLDLNKAEKDIQEVIAELDNLMQREFQKTFNLVAQEFRSIFTRLFNGGVARLILTDPEDITETGIDIEARLPGRREQGLSLLSGGERSLTAVALVFALLRIAPTPFCILDEVDAMLDEANVGRFRELLSELSTNTQFIVITHNRNTVQAAGVIYGITMGRDSASQVISLKLEEVNGEYGV